MPSGGLTWRTCSEASNNNITTFDPFGDSMGYNLIFEGLRVLCAPRSLAAAPTAVASGSGSAGQ